MATRATQTTPIVNTAQALAFVERHGIACEAAQHGVMPSLANAVAGEKLRGSWWAHPKRRTIFAITRALRDAPQILTCRLAGGKITFVHERLWPALVRVAERFPAKHLARVREVHSASGKHVLETMPFPQWVPANVRTAARQLDEVQALTALSMLLPAARNR